MIKSWLRRRFRGGIISSKGDTEIRVCCPFCRQRTDSDDNKHHLYVNLTKPVAYCFRCNWSGHHLSLVMSVEGCSYGQALQYIASPPPDITKFATIASGRGLVQGHKYALEPEDFIPMNSDRAESHSMEYLAVHEYLRNREVPRNLIGRYFGYVRGSGRAWILIDESWWQGRLITAGEPKYLSPPWPKGDSMWNAKALRRFQDLVICEGVFSAIAMGPNALAICGKTMNEHQAQRIVDADPITVFLAFDADTASDAHSCADLLIKHGCTDRITIQYMLDGDPADGIFGDTQAYDWSTQLVMDITEL